MFRGGRQRRSFVFGGAIGPIAVTSGRSRRCSAIPGPCGFCQECRSDSINQTNSTASTPTSSNFHGPSCFCRQCSYFSAMQTQIEVESESIQFQSQRITPSTPPENSSQYNLYTANSIGVQSSTKVYSYDEPPAYSTLFETETKPKTPPYYNCNAETQTSINK